MSVVATLIPGEAALAGAAAAVRPLLGLGLLAAFVIAFKPLLAGMLRAVALALRPHETEVQRAARQTREGVRQMLAEARRAEKQHPALAAELRSIAARY